MHEREQRAHDTANSPPDKGLHDFLSAPPLGLQVSVRKLGGAFDLVF
jgi:hypothetical protein